MDLDNIKAIKIKEGNVKQVLDKDRNVIWSKSPIPPIPTNFLTIKSDSSFCLKRGETSQTGIVEYSLDSINWTEFSKIVGSTTQSATTIFLRGYGNTTLTGFAKMNSIYPIYIGGTPTFISINGDLASLIDYKKFAKGEPITLGEYGTTRLFNHTNWKYITKCFSSITINTANKGAFDCFTTCGWNKLQYLPKIFIENVGENAFDRMFNPTAATEDPIDQPIRIASIKTPECPNEFRIPYQGTATSSYTQKSMFNPSAGVTTLTLNTTYYTNMIVGD